MAMTEDLYLSWPKDRRLLINVAKAIRDIHAKDNEELAAKICGRVWREPRVDKCMELLIGLMSRLKPENSKRDNIMEVGKLQERSGRIRFTEEDRYTFTGYGLLYASCQEVGESPESSEEESQKEKEARRRKKNLERNKRRRERKKLPEALIGGGDKKLEPLKRITESEIPLLKGIPSLQQLWLGPGLLEVEADVFLLVRRQCLSGKIWAS